MFNMIYLPKFLAHIDSGVQEITCNEDGEYQPLYFRPLWK